MSCTRCTSLSLVLVASILFSVLGAAITTIGVMALALPWARALVPGWYSGITLGVGVVILLFAIFGYASLCKKEKKCTLGLFMVFTIIVTALTVASTVFLFRTEEALAYADKVSFVNITDWELSAAMELRGGVERTWDACNANVVDLGAGKYELTCAATEFGYVEDAVNARCLQEDNVDIESVYKECFVSGSWWPAPEGVDPNDVEAVLNTPKGIFCACYSEFHQNVETYFSVGKWVSLGSSIFFGIVFFACCYLCCCSKSPQKQQQQQQQQKAQAYLARP
mmetsp:Transcript_1129/g.3730  ORF Transcript_1129/g.3730 Transcript_1129/m.3730 type:complete len:281 (+) Transcript_1129:64-906(+)